MKAIMHPKFVKKRPQLVERSVSLEDAMAEVFNQFDIDADAFVTTQELSSILHHLPIHPWDFATTDLLMSYIDKDEDGKMKYADLLEWVKRGGAVSKNITAVDVKYVPEDDEEDFDDEDRKSMRRALWREEAQNATQ